MQIGAVTLCSMRGRNEENLARIVSFGEEAAARGCRLVLFPEFSVCGPWVSYDPDADGRELIRQSEAVPGPTTEFLIPHARRLGIAFCVGVAESGLAPRPFNCQIVVDGTGVIHRQRKLQPTVSELPFFRGGGDDVRPFTLDGVNFGITVCADNGAVKVHERLREQGARVILMPHAGAIKKFENPGSSWDELLAFHRQTRLLRYQARARHLDARLIYTDAKDPRRDFNELPDWQHYVSGKSAVYAPDGEIIAENAGNVESLLVTEV